MLIIYICTYRLEYYNAVRSVRMFNQEIDWTQELERCGASNHWRVLGVLSKTIEDTLPRYYVVPKCLTNHEYFDSARSFQKGRAAIWVTYNDFEKNIRKVRFKYFRFGVLNKPHWYEWPPCWIPSATQLSRIGCWKASGNVTHNAANRI